MNYTSQLKGWATDRVIEFYKHNERSTLDAAGNAVIDPRTTDDLIKDAEKLVAFCYCPEEELADLHKRIAEIEYATAQAEAIAMKPASNREN